MAIARDLVDDKAGQRALAHATRKQVMKAALSWFIIRFLLLIGLCIICLLGTLTFQALEMPNELSICEASSNTYVSMEDQVAEKLWSIGQSYISNIDDNVDATSTLQQISAQVTYYANSIRALNWFDGRNCSMMGQPGGVSYKWNTFGSVLFATTIFTTVGYGNIAPLTKWGRIVTFAYGMVGIPYMLWCLSTLGELMADVFQFVYVNVCCLGFCARRARRRRRERLLAENKRRLREAIIEKKLGVTGIPSSWKELYDAREEEMNKLSGAADAMVVDDHDDDEYEDMEDIAIPLTVTLLVIFGYIALGAVMFGMWENWDAMAAAYFCFVTISTIGFGDIVPGAAAKGVKATTDTMKLIVDAVYIVIGMAIISMAFNLIQENMAKKAIAIERKLAQATAKEGENGEDADGDNVAVDPLTARSVMPSLAAPVGRGPASFPFGLPPISENFADKTNAFMQPTHLQPPDISFTAPSAAATPVPPLVGLKEDDDDEVASDQPLKTSARSRCAPVSARKAPKAAAAKLDENETSFNDAKTTQSEPEVKSSPPIGDDFGSSNAQDVK